MTRIVVAGEGLVDLLPGDGGTLRPVVGGSPLNVCVALRRLGVPAAWLGRLSTGPFGATIAERLDRDDIDDGLVQRTGAPTSLAVVEVVDGHPRYGFYLEGTTNAQWDGTAPPLRDDDALHVGFGAVRADDPGLGAFLVDLVRDHHGRRLVTLDPNVRPVADDRVRGLSEVVEELVALVDLVKVSEEDLDALGHDDVDAVASRWGEATPTVLTRGARGATMFCADAAPVSVPAPHVDVVDTVGAGDATMAGLLAWLADQDGLRADGVAGLDSDQRHWLLTAAVRVAAITCTRHGADPPTAAEVAGWAPGGNA